jgi:hypothetical protein
MVARELQRPVQVTAPAEAPRSVGATPVGWPFEVTVERIAAFLNGELPDHPVYDGFELQWFDDGRHGTGMLVFLSRRADRLVDYYVDPALRLDPSGYVLGSGTGAWVATDFEVARLEVGVDGVDAEVRFTDIDGRAIEVRADDRDAPPGRRGALLAPFGDGVDHPHALALVYVHGFGLVRRGGHEPVVRIDGELARTGRLPGAALHRRHLVKYGAPLTVASICPASSGAAAPAGDAARATAEVGHDGRSVTSLSDHVDGGAVALSFSPGVPDLRDLAEGQLLTGSWHVDVDDARITGGTWFARRSSVDRVELGLDVTERWEPPVGQPWLLQVVTRLLPTFRRWPTSYRWRAEVHLGERPTVRARWERTAASTASVYTRLTS